MEFIIQENEKIIEWVELFKFMKNLDDYVTFVCDVDKINIQLMDKSHVTLLNINIDKEWFHSYKCDSNLIFSVNNNIFTKLLALYTKDNVMECKVDDERLHLSYLHKDQNKYFSISQIDIEKELLNAQKIDTDLDFKLKTKQLDKYVNDLSIFGEDIEIKCKQDKLYFNSSNEEGSISIEIQGEQLLEFNVVDDLDFVSKFPGKYICYISKLKISYSNVELYVDDSNPLRIHFSGEHIEIDYYIAPKNDD
jgi:proliferating cell nuclear antigen|tara:strand:- start:920 stop:1669 length:750 start_codon:yes stop_codon:yes gene_type:complete